MKEKNKEKRKKEIVICCDYCIHNEVCAYKKRVARLFKKIEKSKTNRAMCKLFKGKYIMDTQIKPIKHETVHQLLSFWDVSKGKPVIQFTSDFDYKDGDWYLLINHSNEELRTMSIPRNRDHYEVNGINSIVVNIDKPYTRAVYNAKYKRFDLI